MLDSNNYLIMEVEHQTKVERVDISEDNVHYGFEPQCRLELKEPGRLPMDRLVGTLSGKTALHQFKKGDLVAVKLRLWGYKKKGEFINRISIDDIKLVKELDPLFL